VPFAPSGTAIGTHRKMKKNLPALAAEHGVVVPQSTIDAIDGFTARLKDFRDDYVVHRRLRASRGLSLDPRAQTHTVHISIGWWNPRDDDPMHIQSADLRSSIATYSPTGRTSSRFSRRTRARSGEAPATEANLVAWSRVRSRRPQRTDARAAASRQVHSLTAVAEVLRRGY
jgi:hypothetical protein